MHNESKCKLAVCICPARAGDPYCSDYCSQAASQGLQRDFCQCEHVVCSEAAIKHQTISATELPESISFGHGSVTIEYTDELDLRDQLVLLAAHTEAELGADAHARRPPSRELSKNAVAGQSG